MFEQTPFNPIIPRSSLTLYYKCNNCKNPFLSVNKILDTCEYCGSHDVGQIDESDFYRILKSKVSKEGWEQVMKAKKEMEQEFIDLTQIRKSEDNPRLRIN